MAQREEGLLLARNPVRLHEHGCSVFIASSIAHRPVIESGKDGNLCELKFCRRGAIHYRSLQDRRYEFPVGAGFPPKLRHHVYRTAMVISQSPTISPFPEAMESRYVDISRMSQAFPRLLGTLPVVSGASRFRDFSPCLNPPT